MVEPDYYELLGVTPGASASEIKDAYRRAVRTAHPDAGGTSGLFRLITQAYETLRDPAERAAYDARVHGRGVATETDAEEDVDVPDSVDAEWGTETTWVADADLGATASPRMRLLRWAAGSRLAHQTRSLSWKLIAVPFVACLAVLVMPDLIRPEAARPDLFSWTLQIPPLTLVIVAFYIYMALPVDWATLEAFILPHIIVALAFIAWPIAYGDIATSAERWTYGGFLAAWLLYNAALFIIGLVNEADEHVRDGLL